MVAVCTATLTCTHPSQQSHQHADLIAVLHAGLHAGPIASLPGAPQAAVVVTSIMVSMQDVVRQIESGVILETPVPLPGEASKTVFNKEFALEGGIVAVVLGVPEPSTRVPGVV